MAISYCAARGEREFGRRSHNELIVGIYDSQDQRRAAAALIAR